MKWISVEESLPTKENKFIVCLINSIPILAEVHDAKFCLNTRLSFYYPSKKWILPIYFSKVTHWMPINIGDF